MPGRRQLIVFSIVLVIAGCTTLAVTNLEASFGKPEPRDRQIDITQEGELDYWADVKPVLDRRCVVCHACYDAPCQLKLTAPEGLTRGASKTRVYHPERIKAAKPTRLFEDAQTVQEWRDKQFFPVLNEYPESPQANRLASVMYQMLRLKKDYPLDSDERVPEEITLGINREEACPSAETFHAFAEQNPAWGMPYGTAQLPRREYKVLTNWVEQGGEYTAPADLTQELQEQVNAWERFLNKPTLKAQLVSRYIYEHLFLAHLYFSEYDDQQFFKLVRSSSGPGEPVNRIATRRPTDAPGVDRVYYRLVREKETIVAKTHLPYALNQARQVRWQQLFFNDDYSVYSLPDYSNKHAANPFITFADLPVTSRYQFMLDEAQFSIMNFIKGPVCRGQSALNVIKDHFWVFFIDPKQLSEHKFAEFMAKNVEDFELPSGKGDIYRPLSNWLRYSGKQKSLLQARDEFIEGELQESQQPIDINWIWDGNKTNPNAALTVFRHFDSASVEKGLIGQAPQTAWVIGYSLLERIHYLLVAGYDVFGNVGHQLFSRLYMDFLRMEGESNFLLLLPGEARLKERQNWYRNAPDHVLEYLADSSLNKQTAPNIRYMTANPKHELFTMLKTRMGNGLETRWNLSEIDNNEVQQLLKKLANVSGEKTRLLPQNSFILVEDKNRNRVYPVSMLRNDAHLNISSIFKESKNLIPSENTLTVTNGFVGAYPIAFFEVPAEQLSIFVDQVSSLQDQAGYTRLVQDYGIRRTSRHFWQHSDKVHHALYNTDPVSFGILDYNRLENR